VSGSPRRCMSDLDRPLLPRSPGLPQSGAPRAPVGVRAVFGEQIARIAKAIPRTDRALRPGIGVDPFGHAVCAGAPRALRALILINSAAGRRSFGVCCRLRDRMAAKDRQSDGSARLLHWSRHASGRSMPPRPVRSPPRGAEGNPRNSRGFEGRAPTKAPCLSRATVR
jgi:hypothetical protein